MNQQLAAVVMLSVVSALAACAHGSRFVYSTQLDPGRPIVAVVEGVDRVDPLVSQAVAAAIGGREGVFTPAYVTSRRFAQAHEGDAKALDRLTKAGLRQPVVLAVRSTRREPTLVAGEEIRRVDVSLSVRVFRPLEGFRSEAFSLSATGAGFSWDAAERQAVERAAALVADRLDDR